MEILKDLEKSLDDVFNNKLPALPKGLKDFLVKIAPYLTLIFGILGLLATLSIINWANKANEAVDLAKELSVYTGSQVIDERWTFALYLALIVLVVMSIIYIAAFSHLKKHAKRGWDLLFYALLINLVYGLLVAFTYYGDISNFFGSIIGFAIGGYILFQIRSYYTTGKAHATAKVTEPKKSTK